MVPIDRNATGASSLAQKLGQLRDIRHSPPRLVFREQLGRRIAGRPVARRVAINHWLSFKACSHSNVVRLFC